MAIHASQTVAFDYNAHQADHFIWSDDKTLIIGLTPIGRATVVKLELNREGVVNLRDLLHAIGKHPVE